MEWYEEPEEEIINEDFYDADEIERECEDNMISPEEAAFTIGYLEAL